jgi:hypothetical protein
MSFSEVLASYEADEIDEVDALELSGCISLLDLFEEAAYEVEPSQGVNEE